MNRIFACLLAAAPIALVAAAPTLPTYVVKALADPARTADERAADAIRMPAETITFAGVQAGMTVGEFYPGGGYFTRMIADVVGPKGHVYAQENARWIDPKAETPSAFRLPNVTISSGPFGAVGFPKPLDIAWVTQNYHDLKIAKYGAVDTAVFNRAVFAALKPGGTFFVLDHEAPPGTDVAAIEKLHRIEKAQVIREVTAAGFKLVAEGSFLHHASDDHTLSIFDKAVQGKTDQYALRFVKPRT